jgi:haloalkane dehalogenase
MRTEPSRSSERVLRTPDTHFDDLPLWDYEPSYFTSRLYGLEVRMAFYDLGPRDADETILLTHGMSAWSYLMRQD